MSVSKQAICLLFNDVHTVPSSSQGVGKLLRNNISVSGCKSTFLCRLLVRPPSFFCSIPSLALLAADDDNLFSYRANEAGEFRPARRHAPLLRRSVGPVGRPPPLPNSCSLSLSLSLSFPDSRNNEFIPDPEFQHSVGRRGELVLVQTPAPGGPYALLV